MINVELFNEINLYIESNLANESPKSFPLPNGAVKLYEYDNVFENALEFNLELEATFSETLLKYIDDRKLTDAEVYNKANIDRRLFSKIRSNNEYKPSKQTALAFCITLNLNIEETEDLLERAGYALSYSDRSDLIVRFFIEEKEKYTLYDVDEALMSFNLKPISKY